MCLVTWSASTAAPTTKPRAIHCGQLAASERVATEIGVKASVDEPTRTSTARDSLKASLATPSKRSRDSLARPLNPGVGMASV
ncbi:MAG: hypothetical protein AUG43_00295 [Actinobacteria bacterium 13_1_20CM_3_68_10]|nr:MAG: hypothetical protein AUG43_00295 [Actinobacteria bacterium 13_1_20CM_3_68_10]